MSMKLLMQKKERDPSPNFTLLMNRLEAQIVEGGNMDKCHEILERKDAWSRLEIPKQLKWARLAQMAGKVDTALCILSHINQESPSVKEPWRDRLELLYLLGRRDEMIGVLAASRNYFDGGIEGPWKDNGIPADQQYSDRDMDAAAAPFEELRTRRNAVGQFLDLFSGREDCFARQWSNKQEGTQGYVPVRRSMNEDDVEDHLNGRKTYGIYIVRSDGRVNTSVIDVDIRKEYRKSALGRDEKRTIKREYYYLLSRVKELGEEGGMRPLIEFSGGKGFHFWFFFFHPRGGR